MTTRLPEWFAAERVFQQRGGWYVGSPTGFHVGPYDDRRTAQSRSDEIACMLRARPVPGDRLSLLRGLLRNPWTSRAPARQAAPTDPVGPSLAPDVRTGESRRTWFRSERVYRADGEYYIATREGVSVGPYATELEAKADATRLVEQLGEADDAVLALILIREFRTRVE